jgi:hypothetical protein
MSPPEAAAAGAVWAKADDINIKTPEFIMGSKTKKQAKKPTKHCSC